MAPRIFKNARILIVDDEAANVDLLRRLLERAGFSRIESTNDAREAADLYVKFRPDLILLDLHMPHRDGLEVMDELNQIAEASYLPILMLTGDDTQEAKREALVARGERLPEQAVPQRRSAAPDRHAARDAFLVPADSEPEPDPRGQGARPHPGARGGADRDHRAPREGRRVPRRQYRAAHGARRSDGGAPRQRDRAARPASVADSPRRPAPRRREDRDSGLDPVEAGQAHARRSS